MGDALTRPDWADCDMRGSIIRNSLIAQAKELRTKERKARAAYTKDFMRVPVTYAADAYAEAAQAIELRLAVIAKATGAEA